MRYIVLLLVLLLIGCGGRVTESSSFVDSSANTGPGGRQEVVEPAWKTVRVGTFLGEKTYGARGTVAILENEGLRMLTFTNFWVDQGPELKVYLSKDGTLNNAVNLGVLERTTGEQSYGIPGFVDVREYEQVVIYSSAFNEAFAVATLS